MKKALEHLNANRYDGTDLVPLNVARDAINIALSEKNQFLKDLKSQLMDSGYKKDSVIIYSINEALKL